MDISNIRELLSKRIIDGENSVNDSEVHKPKEVIAFREVPKNLTEIDAGITEYVRDGEAFSAVMKHRFSDFHVNEIDLEGNIVQLTNMEVPVASPTECSVCVLEQSHIVEMDELILGKRNAVEIDVTMFDKEKRRDVHKEIKAKYGADVVSNTVEEGNVKKIVIRKSKDCKNKEKRWPDGCGKFLHFVVHKSNLDTIDAVNILCSKLKCKSSLVSYSGTKDKRGKTTQLMCMKYLKPERLMSVNKILRGMTTGNYVFKSNALKLGDLRGNYFQIVLRNVSASDDVITGAIESLKDKGFINYFGLQRFGNSAEVPTYKIGQALCKCDFKGAVDLVLKPRSCESYKDVSLAKKIWFESRDPQKAYAELRTKDKTIEGKLLLGLCKHGKENFINALNCVPRNVRLLYLHSYQSFVWNRVVSKRIKNFGLQVLNGDLIKVSSADENTIEMEDRVECKDEVKILTEDNMKEYTMYDIYYPLPGHSVIYPNNVTKTYYDEILKEDGMTYDDFKQSNLQYSLSGTYRRVMGLLNDLSYDITYYSDPEEPLILSDLEKMNKTDPIVLKSEGEYKALILRFSLNPCSYATMVVREILRIETSKMHQKELNDYHLKRPTDRESDNLEVKKLKTV